MIIVIFESTYHNYLYDKILNQYVELIKKRNEADSSLPSIYSFNTFVYEVLDRLGLEEGEIKMKNWFQEDLRGKRSHHLPYQ